MGVLTLRQVRRRRYLLLIGATNFCLRYRRQKARHPELDGNGGGEGVWRSIVFVEGQEEREGTGKHNSHVNPNYALDHSTNLRDVRFELVACETEGHR